MEVNCFNLILSPNIKIKSIIFLYIYCTDVFLYLNFKTYLIIMVIVFYKKTEKNGFAVQCSL